MIVRLELNSAEKAILCTGDALAKYKLLDISLEYDEIYDMPYATAIGEMYVKTLILYTKVTSIHYQALSKKDTNWKIGVNNLSTRSLQGLRLLFVDKHDDFASKKEEFYNPSIKKMLITINGDPLQLFGGRLQTSDIYPELKKYFYKEHSNVTREDFLTTKFGLWINIRSSTNNTLHGRGRTVEKSGILLQIEKVPETNGDLICYVFSLGDALAHLSVPGDPGVEILTIEK